MIPFGFVPERLRSAIRRGIEEAGQKITYVAKDKAVYDPATGQTVAQEKTHRGRMALSQWRVGPDGVSRRYGTIEAYAFDPELSRMPRRGDLCTADSDGVPMVVSDVTAQTFRDVTVGYVITLQGGGVR